MNIRFYKRMFNFSLIKSNGLKDHPQFLLLILYPLLCSFVIIVVLSGRWELSALILFTSLLLLFSFNNHWYVFLLVLIMVVPFLERGFALRLGSFEGISLMNLCLVSGFLLFIVKNLKAEKKLFQSCPLNWPLLALILYMFISFGVTALQGGYAEPLKTTVIKFKNEIDALLVFFIAFNLPSSRKQVKKVFYFLMGFLILNILLSMLNYYVGIKGMSFINVEFGSKGIHAGVFQPGYRLSGFFLDPNLFAALIILFSSSILSFFFFSKQKLVKWALGICLFFLVLVLVLSGSRGGYVGFFCMLAVFFFILIKENLMTHRQFILTMGAVLVLLVAVYVIYPVPFESNVLVRFTSEIPHNVRAVSHRLELWDTGFHRFLESPVFGHGWRNSVDVHNSYLYSLVTLGLVGFGLYIFIYSKMLTVCYRRLDSNRFTFNNLINISFISGLFGLLAVMFFIGIYSVYHYLFFYAGILMKYNYLAKKEADHA